MDRKHLFSLLVSLLVLFAAMVARAPAQPGPVSAPYPPSRVIRQIDWAPKELITRKAHDSDNWPMTWGDDDALYTAYGDGHGFEPFVQEKLSLGLARVNGMPPSFTGENIRAPSLEQRAAGPVARKASGLLCLDSIFYLWVKWMSPDGKTLHLVFSGDDNFCVRKARLQLSIANE